MYKNAVNLIGFVGKDAEVKAAQDNSTNFTVLSLATKESWRNKQTNEWESRTEWHRILAFGKLGDFASTLTKGAHIEIEGTLRRREQTVELKGSSKKNPETKNVHLGYCISDQTVGNILRRFGIEPAPRGRQQMNWAEFIRSHMAVLAGIDFFTVEVLTWRGLKTYYVLFFLHLETRRVTIAGITRHPT